MILAAEIWHYWIGVVLAAAAILTAVALVVAYLVVVERPRYPKPDQEAPLPYVEPGK